MSVLCKSIVMKSLGWRHFYATNNGNGSNRCRPVCEARDGHGQTTGKCSKASSGCLRQGRDGGICQSNIHLRPLAGGVCEHGRSAACGWQSGGFSCANSMSEGGWTGVRVFWMGALPPLKRGGFGVGKTKRGKGTKWMLVVNGSGIPPGSQLPSASPAEVKPAESPPARIKVHRKKPLRVIADRAYDSDPCAGAPAGKRHPSDRSAPSGTHQSPPSTTDAGCAVTATAGKWNAPLPGRATAAAWSCATTITS